MAPSSTRSPAMSPLCRKATTPGWSATNRWSWWTGTAPATTPVRSTASARPRAVPSGTARGRIGVQRSYDRAVSRTRRLAVVLVLNLGLVASLVVVGLAAHSLAVFAAGADYLADAAAIGVSLLAIWLASRPHGYANATTVAALFNAGWLLTLNIVITVAAAWHLAAGAHRV